MTTKEEFWEPAPARVVGIGEITINNAILCRTGQYSGKEVAWTVGVVLLSSTFDKCHTALPATVGINQTGIDAADVLCALADTLENLMIDNVWDVARICDKYPKDSYAFRAFFEHKHRYRPIKAIRMCQQWPPKEVFRVN
jgi:hypothetical protein